MTKDKVKIERLRQRIASLEEELRESESMVDAIRSGQVDAFAINMDSGSEVRTLYSGDHAYRAMVEQMGEGALNVSHEGEILFANPHFLKLTNKNGSEVIGSSVFDYIHPDSLASFKKMFRKSLAGEAKGEAIFKGGRRKVPMYLSMTSLRPQLDTIGIVATDLTEVKAKEKLILRYQKNLQTKNEELRDANEELASFVYIASHDLQEPLRKIQTFISRIQDREESALSDRGKNYFERIDDAASRMKNLIVDLLAYSRASNGNQDYEMVRVNEALEETLEELAELMREKDATVEAGDLGELPAIPFQFRQLLLNLVGNSIKFNHPDRKPVVKVQGRTTKQPPAGFKNLPKAPAYYNLIISDNGIGFEPKYKNRIFELFQRLHNRKDFSGTGIGLAIVKKILDVHQGEIKAESTPGSGSEFSLVLPIKDL